jgi:energy-coupling factor transporter transmembrane protein EcfT
VETLTSGRVLDIDPTVRMICGMVLLAGVLLTDATTQAGMVAAAIPGAAALFLHRRAGLRMAGVILVGSAMYLPALFWTPPGIVVKGLSATIAVMAPAAALTPHEASVVVMRLPIPAFVRFMVLQMLHQAGVLVHETQAIHRAVVVRGGVHGLRGVIRFGAALPEAWLPRVAVRAERVAVAMELRGYGHQRPQITPVFWGTTGGMVLAGSVVLAGAAVWCSFAGGA